MATSIAKQTALPELYAACGEMLPDLDRPGCTSCERRRNCCDRSLAKLLRRLTLHTRT